MDELEICSYRYLQQIAKSMGLPSNVKKIYLIEMIHAKNYGTDKEVDAIVNRVKEERKRPSQIRKPRPKKRGLQGTEITSTSDSLSPHITVTPRRSIDCIVTSQTREQPIQKYHRRPNILQPTIKKHSASDRVLRSYNTRMRPSNKYNIMNIGNSVIRMIQVKNALGLSETMRKKQQQLNLAFQNQKAITVGDCMVHRQQRDVMGDVRREMVPLVENSNSLLARTAKRQHEMSGISSLEPLANPYFTFRSSIELTQRDGSIAKINAVVQRPIRKDTLKSTQTQTLPINIPHKVTSRPQTTVTVQDVINYKIDRQTNLSRVSGNSSTESACSADSGSILTEDFINIERKMATLNTYIEKINKETENANLYDIYKNFALDDLNDRYKRKGGTKKSNVQTDYPNMSSLTDVYPDIEVTRINSTKHNVHHKKIRAGQIPPGPSSSQKTATMEAGPSNKLPRISEVFSQFSDAQYRDLTQPLHVEVNECDTLIPYLPANKIDSIMLESIYNFKNKFVTNQPLLQIATTCNTKCVYSTPIISSAVAQPPLAATDRNTNSYAQGNQCHIIESESVPRLYDYVRMAEQAQADFKCNEVLNSSPASSKTSSQDNSTNVTIPEMVEDALELISQDGDYMDRIEMDGSMQCILCDWAGPSIILEYHIRKEHTSQIIHQDSANWSIVFTLGALVRNAGWVYKLIHYHGNIFVLSARYEDVDCFMAILTVLPIISEYTPIRNRLTVYNRVSGEPFSWEGNITTLPSTMPEKTAANCLKLDITSLNLLPNSANLKLVNRELVAESPVNGVVGRPELDSIEIELHVALFD